MAKPTFKANPIQVQVPATSANLGPGFDSFGLAFGMYDRYVAQILDEGGLDIDVTGEGSDEVPRTDKNLLVKAINKGFDYLGGRPKGLAVRALNVIPHGRGLGSSASAIVGGLVLARSLVLTGTDKMSDEALLNLATEMEGHPDNVAAALYGGATIAWQDLVKGKSVAHAVHLPVDPRIKVMAFIPASALATSKARKMLPESIPFEPAYVYGCVDSTSCNYDPDANIDNGTCIYAQPFRNCAGGCINDTDGDGICNELEIGGCQDSNADNYDPLATDAGTCIYYGCTNQSACNYDSSATHDNGTCIFPTPYRDCDGNCTETARIIINGEEVDTKICLDIATPDTIVVACDDPESCGYQDPTPNVFYHPSACTYPDLGFNCAGEPVGEAVDDFIAHVNAFGLTYRGLSFLNNYAGTPSYISTGYDFDQDGTVTIADFQTLNTAYGVFIDPEAYVIQPSVQPEVVALRGGQLVGDFPPGATGINNIDDLLGYLANYTPPSGEPDVNDLLEQLVVSAGDPSGDAPIPSSRLQPTETSVGYVDKFNAPLPDVPTTGSEKLKGSYRLLHALAVGELSKAQLQYILVNLLDYTGKPDWHEDTNALTKWFEKGRINTDSIPSLDTLDEDRVNITKKAFTGIFIGAISKNPINDPLFYAVDQTNVLDFFQVWNKPVPSNPTLSFQDKVFSYNPSAYNAAKSLTAGTFSSDSQLPAGATGVSSVNDLLNFLSNQ